MTEDLRKTLRRQNTLFAKQEALRLGFDACGIARADFLEEEAPRLESWLTAGKQGTMNWMANHFDKRLDPRKLVEGAKTVVVFLLNYFPEPNTQQQDGTYKVARYAYGQDYHHVIKKKLRPLVNSLEEQFGKINGRIFVDSAPVMERPWAAKAGLGWTGKHTLLINQKKGSYFFIATLISDLDLQPDGPVTDHCGTCTRCLDACPTDAITAPYQLDARRCISYLTIELKDKISQELAPQMKDWVFGCDICQEVCPWNRFARPHRTPEFDPHPDLKKLTKTDWHDLTEEVFKDIFRKSAVKRAGYQKVKQAVKSQIEKSLLK